MMTMMTIIIIIIISIIIIVIISPGLGRVVVAGRRARRLRGCGRFRLSDTVICWCNTVFYDVTQYHIILYTILYYTVLYCAITYYSVYYYAMVYYALCAGLMLRRWQESPGPDVRGGGVPLTEILSARIAR